MDNSSCCGWEKVEGESGVSETLQSRMLQLLCHSKLQPFINQPGTTPGLGGQPYLSFAREFYRDLNQTEMAGAFPCEALVQWAMPSAFSGG